MNMIKRLLAVTVLLTLALCLVACGGGEETKAPTGSTPVATTPTTVPTTTPTTVPSQPEEYTYRIRVVDENGDPIEGATVMFCSESNCNFGITDAEGWALFNNEIADGYKALIGGLPEEGYEGYIYSEDYIYLAPGQTELILMARPAE